MTDRQTRKVKIRVAKAERSRTNYGVTLKVSKSKYKIRYNFMGNTLIFQFLCINVLNYRYFHTNCSTFLKIKNVGKIKKKR